MAWFIPALKAIGTFLASPAVLGTAAIVGTGAAMYQGRQAQKSQEKSDALQAKQRIMEARRQRVAQIRESRRTAAAMENVAAQTGTLGSSGLAGGTSSLWSQTGAELSFQDRSTQLLNAAVKAGNKANLRSWQAEQYGTIARFGLNQLTK